MVSLLVGLEAFELKSFLIQFLGFTLLVLGNLTYNEIIEWKCCGINSHMSKYLTEEEEQLSEEEREKLAIAKSVNSIPGNED